MEVSLEAGQVGETDFKHFVQEVLAYLTQVAKLFGMQSNKPTLGKFWRALVSKVYEILDKVGHIHD